MEPQLKEDSANRVFYEHDEAFKNKVLSPYKSHCYYLKSAEVISEGNLNFSEYLTSQAKEGASTFFDSWSIDRFWNKQLPDILIVNFKSSFRTPINPAEFSGEMPFLKARTRGGVQYISTTIAFYDEKSGFCDGEVTLAIV